MEKIKIYILNLLKDNFVSYIIIGLLTVIISSFLGFYIILSSYYIVIFLFIFIISIISFLLVDFGISKYGLLEKFSILNIKYLRYIITSFIIIIIIIIIYFFINFFLIIDKIDYTKTNLRFLQNPLVDKKSAIIKNNGIFLMRKNPIEKHPYMGILSIGKLKSDKRFFIEMVGKMNGGSQIGIVLLNQDKIPTEYIELLASTKDRSIAITNVDGKIKTSIEKEESKFYDGEEIKIFMDYKKYDNKACIYYNSIYSKLFNKKCVNLPNNLNIGYLGFKMVDLDTSGNNLYVPEIKTFKVYSLRF